MHFFLNIRGPTLLSKTKNNFEPLPMNNTLHFEAVQTWLNGNKSNNTSESTSLGMQTVLGRRTTTHHKIFFASNFTIAMNREGAIAGVYFFSTQGVGGK